MQCQPPLEVSDTVNSGDEGVRDVRGVEARTLQDPRMIFSGM